MPPGVGRLFFWAVSIDGIASSPAPYNTSYAPPVVFSVAARDGVPLTTAGGVQLVITGFGFGHDARSVTVTTTSGGVAGTVTPLVVAVGTPDTSLIVVAPVTDATALIIDVSVAGQTAAPGSITIAPPTVTLLDVDATWVDRVNSSVFPLLISGTSFGSCCASVLIDAGACTVVLSSHTSITCLTPARAGSVSVRVGGDPARSSTPVRFSVDDILLKPVILDVEPPVFDTEGGTVVLVSGTAFKSTTGSVILDVGTPVVRPCAIVSWFGTNITCIVPPGQGSRVSFTVETDRVQSVPYVHAGYGPPTVDRVVPPTGGTAGGYAIQVFGSNFGVAMGTVTVGAKQCSVTFWSHFSVTCTVPQGIDAPLLVQVHAGAQNSGTNLTFSSFSYNAPYVTGLAPARASASGGTNITILGRDFGDPTVCLLVCVCVFMCLCMCVFVCARLCGALSGS
jgi:hypothetical protein